MEVVRQVRAAASRGIVLDLAKGVPGAGRHRAALPRGEVVDDHLEAIRAVAQGRADDVPRVHEQVVHWVWGEGCEVRLHRIRGRRGAPQGGVLVWNAASRDEREVPRLNTHLAETVVIVGNIRVHVQGKAEDVDGRAPLDRVARVPRGPWDPSRRVKLQLHEGGARVIPDVVRFRGVRAIEDVLVAARRAWQHGDRGRLGVAQGHAEPERWVQLEVEGATGAVLPRATRGIRRELQDPDAG